MFERKGCYNPVAGLIKWMVFGESHFSSVRQFNILLSVTQHVLKETSEKNPPTSFFLSYSSIQTWPAVFVSTLLPHSLEDSSSSWVFRQHTVCGLCVLSYKRQSYFIIPFCSLLQEWEAGLDCPLPHYTVKLAWATVNGRLVARTRLSSLMMGFSLCDKRNKETDDGGYSGGCYEFFQPSVRRRDSVNVIAVSSFKTSIPTKRLSGMGWRKWNGSAGMCS